MFFFSVYTYTNWCNICDYTSSVIPVTTVSQTEDIPEPAPAKFHSTEDEMIFRMCEWIIHLRPIFIYIAHAHAHAGRHES